MCALRLCCFVIVLLFYFVGSLRFRARFLCCYIILFVCVVDFLTRESGWLCPSRSQSRLVLYVWTGVFVVCSARVANCGSTRRPSELRVYGWWSQGCLSIGCQRDQERQKGFHSCLCVRLFCFCSRVCLSVVGWAKSAHSMYRIYSAFFASNI